MKKLLSFSAHLRPLMSTIALLSLAAVLSWSTVAIVCAAILAT